jgi:hypothetical protein
MKSLIIYLKEIAALEPARVRALWLAIVGLLAASGVVISSEYSDAVGAFIIALFTILPLIQGEATRSKVTPFNEEVAPEPEPQPELFKTESTDSN